jgi:diguanylate cyclase
MRYDDSLERSAEYLRLAIQRMTRQDAGLHPVSYALWYEYVAGINPRLNADVDALTRDGARLSDEATYALYNKHIADLDEESSRRISNSVQQIVAQVSESAAQAGDRASLFGDALDRWSGALARPGSGSGTQAAFDGIRRDTRQMQEAVSTLQVKLEESTREAQRLKEELLRAREEARIDALTGLANRKGFDIALQACLATAHPGTAGPCLLMADIDHFKRINDLYGHLFGDKVIRAVAGALKANVKGKDTAARFGGEEFAILLPETPIAGAAGLAEKLRATIAGVRVRRLDSAETIGNVTISIGLAGYTPGESATDFVGRADQALYAAKSQGRNRLSISQYQALHHAA